MRKPHGFRYALTSPSPPVAEAMRLSLLRRVHCKLAARGAAPWIHRVSYDPTRHTGRLPRLPAEHYRGTSFVHWSMTLERRATGWLDPLHHASLREWLCHALTRYQLVCPAYCLMPDHAHFLWLGTAPASDQKLAARLFRETWNRALRPGNRALQRQPHDHVLRSHEREHGAFAIVAHYIFENPVRAGLVADWRAYAYLGALVPGYPDLDSREEDYWETFWRIYAKQVGP